MEQPVKAKILMPRYFYAIINTELLRVPTVARNHIKKESKCMSSFCPDCGTQLKPEWKVCTNCGKPIAQAAPTARQCIQCGTIKEGDGAFCPNCGGQMVEFVKKNVDQKAAAAKKRTIFGSIVVATTLLAFLSFFMGFAKNPYDMTFSAMELIVDDLVGLIGFLIFILLSFIFSILSFGFSLGAIFKRGFFAVTLVMSAIALLWQILAFAALPNASAGFGFILHILMSIATIVLCVVGRMLSKKPQ